jgi:hypothetical protein
MTQKSTIDTGISSLTQCLGKNVTH